MHRKILLFALCAVVCLCGCGRPYTEKDSGKTVYLPIYAPLEIALEGNPASGYAWEVAPYDTSVLNQIGGQNYQPYKDSLGSARKYTFRFQSISAGNTTVRIRYQRPSGIGTPEKSFQLKVVVGTMGRIES